MPTPMPRTFDPLRCGPRATRSFQLNFAAPLSSASLMKQLVTYPRWPFASAGPNLAFPSGAFSLRIAT